MKKIISIILLSLPLSAVCQTDVLGKIKQKVKARAEQRTDETIDKSLDKAEAEIVAGTQKQTKEPKESDPVAEKTSGPMLKSYSRYDFIAGERIVYIEDFS